MTTRRVLLIVLAAFIVLSIIMWILSNSLTPA